jgi:hypothetical protein
VIVFNPLALIEAIFPTVVESSGRCKKCVGQEWMLIYLCVWKRGSFGSKTCVSLSVELIENFMELVSMLG